MWVQHFSSLEFLSLLTFFGVAIWAVMSFVPGRAPPVRTTPYEEAELGRHDRRLAKYFVAGGGFLVLGSLHMVAKNLPWAAERLARAGYAGHLVRDLSNTHVMIVGGGTLMATGVCWHVLPRLVGRPLASEGLAQSAFWLTAVGLSVFYLALVGNGIAMAPLLEHGSSYLAAKQHMGDWYKVPVGMGAGVMGVGYWCFALNVVLTVFQARLVRVPKPEAHLAKFVVTGAAALTVGTVQGVLQVQPAHARWLFAAGHAGEWIDPISHAHINLVTGLTMLVAGCAFYLLPRLGGAAPSRRTVNACYWSLLAGSLLFYATALALGVHEGRLVVDRGYTPEQAEELTPLHAPAIVGAGVAMFAAFWFLLALLVRTSRGADRGVRGFVLAGCAALAVGTLQGPVQAVPEVNELLDRGGQAGDVIVNLHAQLNMLGGLMPMLIGFSAAVLLALGGNGASARRPLAVARGCVVPAAALYYAGGIAVSAVAAGRVERGIGYGRAVAALEPWQALVLVPAAVFLLAGYGGWALAAWRLSAAQRQAGRLAIAEAPARFTGKIPARVRRRSPAALAGYELPMGLLGFPGLGWLFAGFPFTGTILLIAGPGLTWALVPLAFSPYGKGPLRGVGWKFELGWLPATALLSAAALYAAHRRRRARLLGPPPTGGHRRRRPHRAYRMRVGVVLGAVLLVLVSLPFVPAVAGIGSSSVKYSYQQRFTSQVTGSFLRTGREPVALFSWSDPQYPYPHDALRVHAADVRGLVVRAAHVDRPAAYELFALDRGVRVPLVVRARTGMQLALVPARPLAPGRYAFVSTHEGMFGGRDFSYLTVVPPRAATTTIADRTNADVPAIADAFLPVASALVALAFALLLLRSLRARPAGQKALWAIGFALFATACAAEAAAQRLGWTPALFRTYYLAGGVLTVAYLGAGSAWLRLTPRGRDALAGALVVASVAAAVAVAVAPVDAAALAATASGRPPANGALGGHAFLWAVALNSFGSLFLVGGSLWSIVRRQRVRANLWIGSGALVVAASTGLSRGGTYSLVYLGELVGIALMFAGFTFAPRARTRTAPSAAVPAAGR